MACSLSLLQANSALHLGFVDRGPRGKVGHVSGVLPLGDLQQSSYIHFESIALLTRLHGVKTVMNMARRGVKDGTLANAQAWSA